MIILKIIKGEDRNLRRELSKKSITLGRSPKCDLPIKDSYASRQHGEIIFSQGRYIYRDLNSTSGSVIQRDGKEMCLDHVWSECQLEDRDLLIIGKTVFQVAIELPEEPSGTALQTQISHISRPAKSLEEIEDDFQRDRKALFQIIKLGRRLNLEKTTSIENIFDFASDLIFETFPSADRIRLVLKDQIPPGYLPAYVRVKKADQHERSNEIPTRPIIDQVIKDRISLVFNDLLREEQNYPELAPGDIRSAVFVPLWNGQQVLGVLEVDDCRHPRAFGREDMNVLTTFGFELALLIDNHNLYEESVKNARLAGVGQSAAGLSHDIANLMAGWKAGGELIDLGLEKNNLEYVSQGWEISEKKHRAIFDLVEDLRYCSKPRTPDLSPGDINDLIEETAGLQKEKAEGKKVRVILHSGKDIPEFQFDRRQIKRVLVNLLSNAIDATEKEKGLITISSSGNRDNQTVTIQVEDNGSGIPEADREKIFDLLFSTKKSRGTGLGLAIVKKVIDEHGGQIMVQSKVGEGTCFTISLPLNQGKGVNDESIDN